MDQSLPSLENGVGGLKMNLNCFEDEYRIRLLPAEKVAV